MFSIVIRKEAATVLRKMPQNTAKLIRSKLDLLAADPYAPNNNVKALVGVPGYRLRVGDWRVIYELDDALRVLSVERVAPRGRCLLMSREVIERDGKRYVLVPEEIYDRMVDDIDELDDIRAYRRAKATPEEYLPVEVVDRLIDGESPIRVWREHRRLTQTALAGAAKISVPYLSQLESRIREPSLDVGRRLAAALAVNIDDLVSQTSASEAPIQEKPSAEHPVIKARDRKAATGRP